MSLRVLNKYGLDKPLLCVHMGGMPNMDELIFPHDKFRGVIEASWNVMAHEQKPYFVFRRNGRVHLNRRWASVQSTTGSRGVRMSGINAIYTVFRGSVKSTGYPLHSPVSHSLTLPYVTVCHHISTGFYQILGHISPPSGNVVLRTPPNPWASDNR
jgi:hypothetical protein